MIPERDHTTRCPQGNGPGDSFFENEFTIDCDDDFIVISMKMYKFFLSRGKLGLDGKQLYEHLIFTSRLQGSKTVRANINYIKNGLGWGSDKVKKAKDFLHGAGIIEYIQIRNDAGQMEENRIRIKSSWSEESLKAWMERKEAQAQAKKDRQEEAPDLSGSDPQAEESASPTEDEGTGGLEIEPPVNADNTGGLETEPVEHIACSESEDAIYPVAGKTVHRLSRPAVSSDKYKGVIRKEINRGGYNYNDNSSSKEESEPETSPPASPQEETRDEGKGLFSEVQSRLRAVVGPDFRLSKTSRDLIRDLVALSDAAYVLQTVDALLEEKQSKPRVWLKRYANSDLQERLDWCIKTKGSQPKSSIPSVTVCPCCQTAYSGTITACSSCGFERSDIGDDQKIVEHLKIMEDRKQVNPFKIEADSISIRISETGKEYTASLKIYDLVDELSIKRGSSSAQDHILEMWESIRKKAETWARNTPGVYPSIALMQIRSHIEAITALSEDVFLPKQKELF